MEQTEQNISTEELEKLRKKALNQTKISYVVFVVVFVGMMTFVNIKHVVLIKGLLASLIIALTCFCVYHALSFQKTCDIFNSKFKNKYVLQTLQEVPVFSDLQYIPQEGFTFEEIQNMRIVPYGKNTHFRTGDHLTGKLENILFNSSNIITALPPVGKENNALILFGGQIIAFSLPDDRKISEGYLQIFPKKMDTEMKNQAAPHKIETENSSFNEDFSVYASNEEDALHILTPEVIEKITDFAAAAQEDIYMVFVEQFMIVACKRYRNPFDACVNTPLEEQRKKIIETTDVIKKAGEVFSSIL